MLRCVNVGITLLMTRLRVMRWISEISEKCGVELRARFEEDIVKSVKRRHCKKNSRFENDEQGF